MFVNIISFSLYSLPVSRSMDTFGGVCVSEHSNLSLSIKAKLSMIRISEAFRQVYLIYVSQQNEHYWGIPNAKNKAALLLAILYIYFVFLSAMAPPTERVY